MLVVELYNISVLAFFSGFTRVYVAYNCLQDPIYLCAKIHKLSELPNEATAFGLIELIHLIRLFTLSRLPNMATVFVCCRLTGFGNQIAAEYS